MKFPMLLITAVALSFANVGLASDPVETESPIEAIFIPSGFDDNDNIEIVLQGLYPNTCYRTGRSGFTFDEDTNTIKIWATSYRYEGGPCALLVNPFIQVVKIGMVPNGEYQVVYEHDAAVTRTFFVGRRTTESPDAYTYAPVEQAALHMDAESGRQKVVLEGSYPLMLHGCSKITEVKVGRDDEDIVVVQPIMEIFEGDACDGHQIPFKEIVPLSYPFIGKGIIHVRVLNGNSLNRYIEINRPS